MADLGDRYNKSGRWIQAKLDEVEVKKVIKILFKSVVIVADTTFFSKKDGLIVFREPNIKKNIWWMQTRSETADTYRQGRQQLEKHGFTIRAVILDGRRGVRESFTGIPIQMCHFYQKQIINRYLTTRPKLEASKELRRILLHLPKTNEECFIRELNNWHGKWKDFLKEKTINPKTGRWCYTHKRVRSAIRSLETNLPYLFTYQKYSELYIPNTTNSLDGFFNRLKSLINVHRGLNTKRRNKIVNEIMIGRK